jgi:hypothetical protein
VVAEDRTLLKLLALVDELYEQGEEEPRSRGRPYHYSEVNMLKVFVVMVLKRIKHFKSLYRFLEQNPAVGEACGLASLPDRRTLGRRLKSFPPFAQKTDSSFWRETGRQGYQRRDGGGGG